MRQIEVGHNEAGQRLDRLLHRYLGSAGDGFLYKMLRKKNITLNGKRATGSERLKEGDLITLFMAEETLKKFGAPKQSDLIAPSDSGVETKPVNRTDARVEILYEDEDVLLANKPAGMLTQKAVEADWSLNDWLLQYLLETGAISGKQLATYHPSVCNRLDRNTSGIVLCGKSLAGSRELSRLLRERSLRKFYRLFVAGQVAREGRIDGWLTRDEASNTVKLSLYPPEKQGLENGKVCAHVQTGLKRLWGSAQATYLEVELITGKTHQIRAQMAALGTPVIGDPKYGNRKVNSLYRGSGISAQLLHAVRVEFPTDMQECKALAGKSFIAPEPESFAVMKRLLQIEEQEEELGDLEFQGTARVNAGGAGQSDK